MWPLALTLWTLDYNMTLIIFEVAFYFQSGHILSYFNSFYIIISLTHCPVNLVFRKYHLVGFYRHEAMIYCYITADGILCIQLVMGFIACGMLSHVMYFVRNDEIKNPSLQKHYIFIRIEVNVLISYVKTLLYVTWHSLALKRKRLWSFYIFHQGRHFITFALFILIGYNKN